jgi:phosphopantothenoylcysteine decarboxylase/phosphopantothenate--cysteine ligase
VETALPCDIFIAAAAVADWRTEMDAPQKIKKGADGAPVLKMVENPDILYNIAQRRENRPSVVVGFAAETEKLIEHARAKLTRKGCDLIVANDIGAGSEVMGGSENTMVLVSSAGEQSWPKLSKDEAARRLVAYIAQLRPTGGD